MATWSKVFSFFRWKNRPDTSTPLGQTLLNRINEALNEIDNRVIALNSQKASTDEIQGVFTDVRLIKNTGQFVFTLFDGTEKIIDTALEKISINVSFDQSTQMMVLEKEDGSKEYVDLSVFTTQYESVSSPTIQQTVTDGKVRADIKPNSITDQMLQTNYLADITTQANTAVSASQSALESQSLAEQSAEDADRHADRAEAAADRAEAITGFTVDINLDKNSSNPIANKAVAEALENVDAKTLGGHGAEYFFPKSGGTVDGSIFIQSNEEVDMTLSVGNSLKRAGLRVYSNGVIDLYDYTNARNILRSTADGTNTFNGTASGNLPLDGSKRIEAPNASVFKANNANGANAYIGLYGSGSYIGGIGFTGNADYDLEVLNKNGSGAKKIIHTGNVGDYALPNSGGTVEKNGPVPLGLKNTNSATDEVLITFSDATGQLGMLGFKGKNTPIFYESGWANHRTLLHTGNKPTGTYTGNGEGWRSVEIGGVGTTICVCADVDSSKDFFALVGLNGYIAKKGGSIVCGNNVHSTNAGKLVIDSSASLFNKTGITYHYERL